MKNIVRKLFKTILGYPEFVVAAMSKTGTKSVHAAMAELGYKVCLRSKNLLPVESKV